MKKKTRKKEPVEPDSTYILKIIIYIILGTLWLKFDQPIQVGDFYLHGLPVGLLLGLLFARHDHFAIDRKIEYAVLILMTIICFFLPAGIVI